jgi:hypothetical protein
MNAEADEEQAPEGKSLWWALLPLIACLGSVIWFFRDFFQFGFDRVAGDIGDNRFIVAILEHWRRVFLGQMADFTSPIFFYPEKGVLGSSEALFLFAIPYTIARATGADMPLSFEITLIVQGDWFLGDVFAGAACSQCRNSARYVCSGALFYL